MEQDTVSKYFYNLIHSPTQLHNGAQLIKNTIRNQQQFVLDTIQYLSSEEEPSKQQLTQFFQIITLVHPPLIEVFSQLGEKTQQDIRGGLLNIVVTLYKDLRCISALGLLIRELIQIDTLDPWLQPFQELLNWVSSDEPQIVQAGIQFFIYVLKETQYNQSNSDLPLHKMAAPLFQVLYQIFANSELSETLRQKLLYLVLQLIKTFSVFDGVNDAIVKEAFDTTFDIWMSFFVSTLQSTIYSNIRIKKYILKIVVIIYRDMQKYLSQKQKQQPTQIYVIWQFCYKALPLHLWANIWDKDLGAYKNKDNFENEEQIPNKKYEEYFAYFDDENEAMLEQPESLVLTILQFISVLTSIPQLNTTIKVSIHHLTNALFHYMLMPENDTLYWKSNTQQFLSSSIMTDYQVTIRSKSISILNELIEKCGDYAIQAILMISEKFLLNIHQAQTTESTRQIIQNVIDLKTLPELTSNIYDSTEKLMNLVKLSSCDVRQTLHVSGQTWKKMQVALIVIGRFAEDVIVFQSKQQGAFDIQTFVKGLIKQVKDDEFYELLKGQSLYCLTRFTQIISIKYRWLFTQLALACINCLKQNYPISLKVISCRALTLFLRKLQKHKLQFSQQDRSLIQQSNIVHLLMTIPLYSQITNIVLQALIQVLKNHHLGSQVFKSEQNALIYPEYLLSVFHKNISHSSTIQLFFNLLEEICKVYSQYKRTLQIFIKFIEQCLKSYCNIVGSEEQTKYLKNADIQLILIVLKITNVLIIKGNQLYNSMENSEDKIQFRKVVVEKLFNILPIFLLILKTNSDTTIHVHTTICFKNIVKLSSEEIRNRSDLSQTVVQSIKALLKIPKDKSFESASIYAGNLAILAFDKIFPKTNYEILQQAVLKVFRSRTPSVIQSLVLIYSRIINMKTDTSKPFQMKMKNQITDIIDFLSSFSIQNRMGLKILIDKWLLQQSLFRGKYTKISTFMALSKLFLLGDKRVDNLLVIGFNPSHTNVSNDVNAPLKILATLIRCLDNEKGFQKTGDQNDYQDLQGEQTEGKQQQKTVQVNLQKFKQQKNEDQQGQGQGGLADRQNQQGSTCYMSAMLEFYDDGEECDETTEQDLIFLDDTSTNFVLADYLIEFFNYLIENKKEYFKECLKGILKQDVKTLQKYVKIE